MTHQHGFERFPMQRINIVYWEEEGGWIGYLQEYPDYWTQGDSLDDLKEHLKDLYQDITSDQICPMRGKGM
jgi:predicted RNase H-like HicB family nuclease